MMPVLQIGPLAVSFPMILLLAGLWLGFRFIEKKYLTDGIEASKLIDGLIVILIGAVIGARVGYLIRYPSIFLAAPAGIFSLSTELLDPWGGLVVALVMMIRFLQREEIAFWTFIEAIAPFIFMMAITYVLISFANLEGFGTESSLPWSVNQAGAMRHPYQLYFVILMVAAFFGYDQLKKKAAHSEQLIGYSLFVLGLAFVFAFGFQADAIILLHGLRTLQVLGLVLMGVGVWKFGFYRDKS